MVDVDVKPNFRVLGKRYGKRTQAIANAIHGVEPQRIVAELRERGTTTVEFEGTSVEVTVEEVIVTEVPRSGWVVETQRGGVTIALDTDVTPELAVEGTARDVIRVVQRARRAAELDISDRVRLAIAGPESILAAVKAHQAFVAHETLAESVSLVGSLDGGFIGAVGPAEIAVGVSRAACE